MKLNYYYLRGRYDVEGRDFLREVGFTNAFHAWSRMAYTSSVTAPQSSWLPQMVQDVKDAIALGKEIVLALNMNWSVDATDAAVRGVLRAMKPYWGRIISVELADEPRWTKLATEGHLRRVRRLMAEVGVAKRPLYVVYIDTQILKGNAFLAVGSDAVGIEAYIPYKAGESTGDARLRMSAHVAALLHRLPAGKKVVMVGMAYSRNGTWTNPKTLIAVQEPYWEIADRLDQDGNLLSLNLFSYGRPSGTFEKPLLKREHKRLRRVFG